MNSEKTESGFKEMFQVLKRQWFNLFLAYLVLIIFVALKPGSAESAQKVLVAPEASIHVDLPQDISLFKTGDPVVFVVEGWYCVPTGYEDFDFIKDIDMDVKEDLTDLLHLAKKISAIPTGKLKGHASLTEINGLKSNINQYAWFQAYYSYFGADGPAPEEVSVGIPAPGGTNTHVEKLCYTEKELEQAWSKIRQWYFDEADRIINSGL